MEETNRRNHFRVEISVPVKWKILTQEEIELLKKGMGENLFKHEGIPSPIDGFLEQTPPGSKEEQIFRSLQFLNNKLDFIIEQLLSKSMLGDSNQDNLIEISASGIKFRTDKAIEPGAFLKMDLIMPGTYQYQIELICNVVRVEKGNDSMSMVATHIVDINPEARDSIVKMVFQKQRIDIRRSRNMEEDKNLA